MWYDVTPPAAPARRALRDIRGGARGVSGREAPLPKIESRIDPHAQEFRGNAEHNRSLAARLRERLSDAKEKRSQKAVDLHKSRGKLLARERIDAVLDPGVAVPRAVVARGLRPLRRTSARPPGSSPGIGRVAGLEVMFVANDATVKGGTYLPADGQKAPARPGNRRVRIICRASTSSTPAARSFRCRPTSFPIATTSGGSSTTCPHVGEANPTDRGRARLVHGRRRVRSRDGGRDCDRERERDDLPRAGRRS